MKKEFFEFRIILLLLLILSFCSDLKSQTLASQDSIILIRKIRTFLVSNPAPQYIVEIRNDMNISFYNNLPIEFFQNHPAGLDNWGIDSTTTQLDSADYKLLRETINGINLSSISTERKRDSENEIEVFISGGPLENYIIEMTNQRIEFSIGPNNEKYISDSAKKIRHIIDELEEKYKPMK